MNTSQAVGRPARTVLGLLLGIEGLAFVGLALGWPLLGDYYEASSILQLGFPLIISLLTIGVWYWIVRGIATYDQSVGALNSRLPLRIPRAVVWLVITVNFIATFWFGYGSVGYTGVPFAFLITIIPIEPLLVAYMCQRRKLEPALLFAFAVLGLIRGWSGHLLLIFILIIFLISSRKRVAFLLSSFLLLVVLFEPMMELRAMIRGYDDGTTSLAYRLASRLAIMPIVDYIGQNLAAVAACNGLSPMAGWVELISAIVPRAWFGNAVSTTINQCLAAYASGDPLTQLSFSTSIFPKLLFIFFTEGLVGGLVFLAAITALVAWQLRLARRYLGASGYIYIAIFLHSFFVSGVPRDLMIPAYFLALLVIARIVFFVARPHHALHRQACPRNI